jgi:hypothetical protein
MKRILTGLAGFIVIIAGLVFLFQDEMMAVAMDKITADMFVEADTDSFDPGLAVGETFPSISAVYQGKQLGSIQAFMGDKGMVFFANRSVDW